MNSNQPVTDSTLHPKKALEPSIALSPDEAATAEVLAVLDRPAGHGVLGRALERPNEIGFILEKMVQVGIIRARSENEQVLFHFAHPCTSSVIVDGLDIDHRRSIHHAIAGALGKRRRNPDATKEVAEHLRNAGQIAAFAAYIQSAKGMIRQNRYSEVIQLCTAVEASDERRPYSPMNSTWIRVGGCTCYSVKRGSLAGNGMRPSPSKMRHKRRSIGDKGNVARCLVSLGRSHYRLGRFDHASPLLEEA